VIAPTVIPTSLIAAIHWGSANQTALLAARKAAKLSRTELGARLNISGSWIQKLEGGSRPIATVEPWLLFALCRVLDVTPDQLGLPIGDCFKKRSLKGVDKLTAML
jgi:transcriptional regulator with XRE-family HTH domain